MSEKNKVQIKLPGDEFPYNNVEILDGAIDKIGVETFIFTTVSNAGVKRKVSVFPNGVITKEDLGKDENTPSL